MNLGARATAYFLFAIAILTLPLASFGEQDPPTPPPAAAGITGEYLTVLTHEGTNLYQFASINLSVVGSTTGSSPDGTTGGGKKLKLAANVRIYFGEMDSSEFLIYQYNDLTMDPILGRLTLQNDQNDVSLVGFLKQGKFQGEWFSKLVGRVGTFAAERGNMPEPPNDGQLVKTVGGHYVGTYTNTNPESAIPELNTIALVTTQDISSPTPAPVLSGSTRFYWGPLGSIQFQEEPLTEFQFNFYRRDLTMKAKDVGVTFKGKLSLDGVFTGTVHQDGLGKIGTIKVVRQDD